MSERILGIASVVAVSGKSLRITLIEEAVRLLGVKKGDKIAFIQDITGRIYIRKA